MKIAVVGLGYVGLPLSMQFARSGVEVLGLDIDAAKVTAINEGRSYIRHIDGDALKELVSAKKILRLDGFQPGQGSRSDSYLRADSAGSASRAGSSLTY